MTMLYDIIMKNIYIYKIFIIYVCMYYWTLIVYVLRSLTVLSLWIYMHINIWDLLIYWTL